MTRRLVTFLALALVLALLFVRLGVWQLARLEERREVNARVLTQLERPVVPFTELQGDTSFRRASVSGSPDYEHEILHIGRTRNGSPGVHIFTPVRVAGSDTAVLVNRGWVYAPDAATADLSRWREQRLSFSGFVMQLSRDPVGGARPSGARVRVLALSAIQPLLPYPVAGTYLVAEDSAGAAAPVRVGRPPLDDGPHLSYAIQWFCFAAIAIGGAIIVAIRTRGADPAGAAGAWPENG